MKIASRINQSIKILSLTAALGFGFTLPALALDGDAFFARIQSEMKESGLTIEAGKVAVDGNNVSIPEAIIKGDIDTDLQGFAIKNLVFSNVEEHKDGSYLVDSTAADEVKFVARNDPNSVSVVRNLEIAKLLLRSKANETASDDKLPYETISIKKLETKKDGKDALILDDFSFGFSEYDPEKSIKLGGGIGNLLVDVASMPKSEPKDNLTKLGFEKIEVQGNIELNANLDDGHVDLTFHGNMNDAGQLDINIGLAGLTKDLAQELVRISKQANSASQKDQQTASLAMFGLIQQLSLNTIDIKFDDNSITNKVIDLQKGADVKREDFVAQLKMILPMALGQLQHPQFAAKVSEQLGKYLDNPQNLEVTAKPENGAPFAVIAATAMTSPKALIDLLKVDVKANQ